jgi:hypothetical protein
MASTELKIFTGAIAVETVHLLDDGLVHPHDGVTDVASALVSVAIMVAAVALYPRLAPWARATLAALFGLAGLLGGLDMHVIPALQHGAGGSDYTGFGQAAAGVVLLLMAAGLALRPAAKAQPTAAG